VSAIEAPRAPKRGEAVATPMTPALRLASAVTAVVLVLAALIVLGHAGYWGSLLLATAFRWGTPGPGSRDGP
jgi:hypothetical protein